MKPIKEELSKFIENLDEDTAIAVLGGFRLACLNLEQETIHRMIELDCKGAERFLAKRTFDEVFNQ